MSMTMTQKILASKAGLSEVSAGEYVEIELDVVLGNDITTPVAIDEMTKHGLDRVHDQSKIVIVPDHFTPNKDIKTAQQCQAVRAFVKKHEIENYFEVGQMGIEHCLLPEKGLVVPGDAVIGADSHTCTYGALGAFSTGVGSTDMAAGMASGKTWFRVPEAMQFVLKGELGPWVSGKDVILHIIGMIGVDGARYKSMEFTGPGLATLSMDDRFAMANMAIEAGAKNGIFEVDDVTMAYVNNRGRRPAEVFKADPGAAYEQTFEIDLSSIEPVVAFPSLPSNTRTFDNIPEISIDQVVIGSCTNGRIEDLRAAAEIFRGRSVKAGVRTIIIPGTQNIYLQAIEEGLIQTFVKAGAVVSTPTCGPCLGGHMGILAEGERAVATTNRNFVGRMGHPKSEVYLASPAVAAASAVTGRISHPKEVS